MATYELKLTGWKAVLVILLIVIFVGYRFISKADLIDNAELMRKIEVELTSEYLPGQLALFAQINKGKLLPEPVVMKETIR